MNPANKNQYKFDGQWMNLEQDKAKLKVKGIPITIGKKIYWSKYGATLKTDKGVFALRVPATMDIKALEEWYRMNKAKNFTEFYKAVSITSLPMFNIMYADRYDTIFYISNGKCQGVIRIQSITGKVRYPEIHQQPFGRNSNQSANYLSI